MEYIISEEKFKEYCKENRRFILMGYETFVRNFLKYKQPIVSVEVGRMIVDENNKPKIYTLRPDDHWAKKGTQFGSLYKIYIQKVKE